MNDIQSTEELRLTARLNKFHNQERDEGATKFDANNMLEWLRETHMDDLIAYQKSTAIGDVKHICDSLEINKWYQYDFQIFAI